MCDDVSCGLSAIAELLVKSVNSSGRNNMLRQTVLYGDYLVI